MKIYLIGYMASGKTNVGKELATLLNMDFIDLDEIFEERYHVSILDFFSKYGEGLFRTFERQILYDTASRQNTVISTGGGTPCFFDNMNFIKENGFSVFLNMPFDELIRRLTMIRKRRPLLKGVHEDELEDFVRKQMTVREPFYNRADLVLSGPDYDLNKLIEKLKNNSKPPNP